MLPAIGFWFLRHGETDWNAQGLSQGAVDVPLNAIGEAQARRAAELLSGTNIASIVASPLARARRTAETAAAALGLPVAFDAELREVAFAGREGQPLAGWFEDWIAGTMTPPGAESFADLRARALRAVTRALAAPAPVLIVAHGAFFRALRAEMRLPADVRTPNAVPIFCEPPPPTAPEGAWSLQAAGSLSIVGAAGISG
jgi:2,3-bisphosphoglycerate-dependent phosphoglycerate mutase